MDIPVEYIEGKKGIKQIFKWYNRMDEWNKHSTPTTIDSLLIIPVYEDDDRL